MLSVKNFYKTPVSRTMIDQFYGYNHNPIIAAGEFHDMTNMTSDNFPIASTRKRRLEQLTSLSDGTLAQDSVAVAGREDFGFSILNNGDIYCGGSTNAHKLSGLLQVDGRTRATEVHSGRQITVTFYEGQFLAKIAEQHGIYHFYCEPGGWTDDNDNPVALNEYGITVRKAEQGDMITVTVDYVNAAIPETMLPKKLVSMGAWVLIWPDKVYVNAVKLGNGDEMAEGVDYGHMDNTVSVVSPAGVNEPVFYVRPCTEDGTAVVAKGYGKTADIADPEDGDYCCDLEERQWYQYTETDDGGVWLPVRLYTSLEAEGIAVGFYKDDYITIEKAFGIEPIKEPGSDELSDGNYRRIVDIVGENKIILDAFFTGRYEQARDWEYEQDICTIRRNVPELDYVVECGNRLWGCFYGEKDGEHINEIYACKLGDFRNWNCFAGISTDSYVASRGADGKFTGAAVLNGNPLFFRERSFEKVFPSSTGAHQITTVNYPGIQDGSDRSTAIIESTLYYKGIDGIYAYTGSVPRMISSALGNVAYFDGVAAPLGRKYYISMHDAEGYDNVFVYDTSLNLWHREDGAGFVWAEEFKDSIYFLDRNNRASNTQRIGAAHDCKDVPWSFETGIIGLNSPDQKRISRLVLRFKMELGARAKVYVQYNSDGHWHYKTELHGNGLHTTTYPIVPIRCDHMRIRITGIGGMELYSMTYSTETGSDLP